ncbi:MAG: Flp family type IVb pilin [Bacillota bacterium]|nr:Flp family type IVb pilin [Bacillota bacterium]MDI7250736.1 Flp family type IVb pilin [Bacillota bacterium]
MVRSLKAAWDWLRARVRREEGATIVEYIMVIVLVLVGTIVTIVALRSQIVSTINAIITGLQSR